VPKEMCVKATAEDWQCLFRQSIALVLTTKDKEQNATYTRNTKEKQKKLR